MGYLGCKNDVFTAGGDIHCFEDCGNNLLVVEVYVTAVSLKYTFYHDSNCFIRR